jgi:aminoglycoside phosphotransferase family enzyme/predicted kinase
MNQVAEALRHPQAYPHPTEPEIEVIETHISWIFLTGKYAYKLKKAVNLGFLDFSTLERRRHYCFEELRLNRRLCPELYLDVLPVTAEDAGFRIDGDGIATDYVIRMIQFDRKFELDRLLGKNELSATQITEAATLIADFHSSAPRADPASMFGTPELILKPMLENLDLTEAVARSIEERSEIETMRHWTINEHRHLSGVIRERKALGMVRECHGDLHTGNMLIRNGRVMIFDCIEFSHTLSIIDIISDIAFLFMDLEHSGHKELAWHFLNAWLSKSGDYAGLRVLRFYCAYRAMVRAKVTSIRLAQESGETGKKETLAEHISYLKLALDYTRPQTPVLLITHGVSGSGKSRHSSELADRGGFIHIRSDIERKRLFGIDGLERSASLGIDIYTPEATQKTYDTMLEVASSALSSGFSVIVDATFTGRKRRLPFIRLANSMNCRCHILCFHASHEVLRQRVEARHKEGGDPSEADLKVLASQLHDNMPPDGDEKALCIDIDTEGEVSIEALLKAVGR